ncbi:MAG: alpha-1,2-fucosyltransferase [Edaphobacter sp.]|uniref:alpha-1,2-fucosyltransferase n=1 Tax=Edaphobacter sp. TaxID=1934404 RepID=UPI0023867371|nr:alpha-1,2-fucosyltransferase [Edaphobacter sp.]MDE1177730.1 alpha-1,2-fucosyltransferase [Edaphobacter sp.]
MKILLRQKSGLGNQLFQYAAGLFFARRYGATLEVIREREEKATSFGHPRPFLLPKFCISTTTRERNGRDQLLCSTASYKGPLAKMARLATGTRLYKPEFVTDWVFQPDLPVNPSTRIIYLDGYFQAHQYATEIEETLRAELTLCQAPQEKNRIVFEQIQSCEHPVSLHVRRGDYTTIYGGRDALPMTYYQNAIDAIQGRVAKPTFFVFSDDIAFCRENLPAGPRYIFVDHNNEMEAHEDLRLMSSCCDHIIANSSFSWWGAWLNPNPDKIVLAPDRWLDPAVPHPDLIPSTWKRISTAETASPLNA